MKSKNSNISKILANTVKSLIMPVAVYLIVTAVTAGRFGNWSIIVTVLRTTVVPMLIAMAMSMPMIMGMWDFSSGAVVYAAAILGANVASVTNTGVLGLCVSAMLIAVLLTAFSGVLYNLMKIPSLVLTLGLVMVYESFPRLIVETGCGLIEQKNGYLAQAPWCFILFLIMYAIYCIVYNFAVFGQNIRAIGANQPIAYSAGVDLSGVKFRSFLLGGVFLGMAAILTMSMNVRLYVASSMNSISLIFDPMMGVYIALFLSKYCRFTTGLLIGTFTMRMLSTGLVSCGLSATARSIVTGFFLLAILCFSSNQGRFEAWTMRKKLREEVTSEIAASSSN